MSGRLLGRRDEVSVALLVRTASMFTDRCRRWFMWLGLRPSELCLFIRTPRPMSKRPSCLACDRALPAYTISADDAEGTFDPRFQLFGMRPTFALMRLQWTMPKILGDIRSEMLSRRLQSLRDRVLSRSRRWCCDQTGRSA
ncbi:hypothetical protein ABW21_db0201864 [Orbilia brochopaga]|nr:hypothetical protein ABW21_db0201864 [Drechslerella brochopaga]